MSATTATVGCRSATLEAVVTRCGCSAADKQQPAFHGRTGAPCPKPQQVERLGVISYWHRNPLRRLAWRLKRFLSEE